MCRAPAHRIVRGMTTNDQTPEPTAADGPSASAAETTAVPEPEATPSGTAPGSGMPGTPADTTAGAGAGATGPFAGATGPFAGAGGGAATATAERPPLGPPPTEHRLRRSRSDRIGAGVAGGLGRYFGVDPVLFRVLFAVAAFFGGSGVLAYVLLWALIPEEGTDHASVDDWLRGLRGRNIPVWAAMTVGVVVLWGLTLSWWAPHALLPLAVVAVIVGLFATRSARQRETGPLDPTAAVPIDLTKGGPTGIGPVPDHVLQARAARAARAERRRPVWMSIFALLLVAMLALGLVDWLHGLSISAYFWVATAVLAGGFLVSLLARRTVWTALLLLIPALIGGIAFHGTAAGLGDGAGQQTWAPTGVPAHDYRLLLGDARLDLSGVKLSAPRQLNVDMGAGQLTIVVPRSVSVHIDSHLNAGSVMFAEFDGGRTNGGVGFEETLTPASDSNGPVLNVDVHVAMGAVRIVRG